MSKKEVSELLIQCPHCRTRFSYFESSFRPFCSERCKMVDLGHWLHEEYRVPTPEIPDDFALNDRDEDN